MSQTQKKVLISYGKIVLPALVGGIAAFAIAVLFISAGLVSIRYISLPEKSYAIIAFRNIYGEIKIVEASDIAGVNPAILMTTGDFAMELTVVTEDTLLTH